MFSFSCHATIERLFHFFLILARVLLLRLLLLPQYCTARRRKTKSVACDV